MKLSGMGLSMGLVNLQQGILVARLCKSFPHAWIPAEAGIQGVAAPVHTATGPLPFSRIVGDSPTQGLLKVLVQLYSRSPPDQVRCRL